MHSGLGQVKQKDKEERQIRSDMFPCLVTDHQRPSLIREIDTVRHVPLPCNGPPTTILNKRSCHFSFASKENVVLHRRAPHLCPLLRVRYAFGHVPPHHQLTEKLLQRVFTKVKFIPRSFNKRKRTICYYYFNLIVFHFNAVVTS